MEREETAVFSLRPNGEDMKRVTPWRPHGIGEAVSPDGRFLIGSRFDRETGYVSITRASIRRGEWRRLTHDNATYGSVQISPSSRFIAFNRAEPDDAPPPLVGGAGMLPDLYVMDLRTKASILIKEEAVYPTWAGSDGRLMFSMMSGELLERSSELFSIRRDGSGLRQLTSTSDAAEMNGGVYSPLRRRILFERHPDGQQNENDGPFADIWSMNVDDRTERQVTAEQDMYNGVETPRWAPDGKRISFEFVNDGFMAAFIARPDGSEARAVTGRGDYTGGTLFSPNSRRVVVWVSPHGAETDVLIARADGSNERWLLRSPRYSDRPIGWVAC